MAVDSSSKLGSRVLRTPSGFPGARRDAPPKQKSVDQNQQEANERESASLVSFLQETNQSTGINTLTIENLGTNIIYSPRFSVHAAFISLPSTKRIIKNRAVALTSLAGIGLFAVGLVALTSNDGVGISGHIMGALFGLWVMSFGMVVLGLRRELFSGPNRITTAKLREDWGVMFGLGVTLGFFGVAMGVSAANDGILLAAVPLEIEGLSSLGVMIMFCFSRVGKRQDALGGAF
jgi:hypothetical protein